MTQTTILLVDDHPMLRKGLRSLLDDESDMRVVGEAGDGRVAIEQVRELSPDVVIMDITMPDIDGIAATRHIVTHFPGTRVVALSIHSGKRFVENMLRAGAAGYILKESVPEEMIDGIRTVMRGDVYLSAAITGTVVAALVSSPPGTRSGEDTDGADAEETVAGRLILTKLHRPEISAKHVHRPRLIETLENGRHKPLVSVAAPAGYGKSVLISSWLEACQDPAAWISLDENDNDLRMFLTYLIAAVESIFPGSCRDTNVLLDAIELPPVAVLSNSLLHELGRIKRFFFLVLDDYHLIQETAVQNLMAAILKYPLPSLHLVIIGRRDPSLPIAGLRAKRGVTEIRTQDLRFTVAETETLLKKALGIQIDPATAFALEQKSEGWVTGIHLAALSMRHQGDIGPTLIEAHADGRYVMEYLFNEVLADQPPEVRQYLLGTAILDRFCGSLCEAACVPGAAPFTCEISGWEFIARLTKQDLFLIPLDAGNRWFRYHHLFQQLLRNQLKRRCSREEIKTLHARVSAWFFDQGLIEEGLQHSLAAGDIPQAMRMVAQHGHTLMNDQQWPRLASWLGRFPRDQIEQDAELLILEAWLKIVSAGGSDLSTLETYTQTIKILCESLPAAAAIRVTQIKGHLSALRAIQCYLQADGENARKHARAACENIPLQHKRARVSVHIFQAGAYQMVGDLETGLPNYLDEIKKSARHDNRYLSLYQAYLCFIYWMDADLNALLLNIESPLKRRDDGGLPGIAGISRYFQGIACYHQNKLQKAEEALAAIGKDFYFVNPVVYAHSAVALALVYQAGGSGHRARKVCKEVVALATENNHQDALLIMQAFEAEQALRRGYLAVASAWARRFMAKSFLPPTHFYWPILTLIKIRLAEDTADSQQQAADLLDELDDFLASIHNHQFRIHVLALQVMLYDTLGERPAGLEKLAKALDLAEPGGFIRLFVDLGPQMAELLKQLLNKQNVAVDYIKQILAAFSQDGRSLSSSPSHPTPQPLVDPLTHRELDILELLAQRLQNKEIAEKLFISDQTVKGHLKNIYQKLGVKNRRQAVEKAQALGILAPHMG